MAQLEKNIALVQERARNEDIDWEDDERDGKVYQLQFVDVIRVIQPFLLTCSTSMNLETLHQIGTLETKTPVIWNDLRRPVR